MQKLKHELKKIGSLALFFFISFGYVLLIMKLFLKEYSINTYVLSKAIVGALIAAKAVAILDSILDLDKFCEFPRYVNVLYKTLVYTLAVLILGSIEGIIETYRKTRAIPTAITTFIDTENFYRVLAVTLCMAIVFLIYNIWREIDSDLGKGTLNKFFLSRPQTKANRLG